MLNVVIVQQGAWDMPLDSMPLASAYLKAMVEADADLRQEVDVRIRNFRGGRRMTEMARVLFSEQPPDMLAFSVFGWNYRTFACLAETYKQLKPDGLVVFGGTHVAHQAERIFREYPWVDVVVNGEGEFTFVDLLTHMLEKPGDGDLKYIKGISYRDPEGVLNETEDVPRIENLDIIPSPFLMDILPMHDGAGNFKYDVALMETNRGCPYKCSFCYWGGAVGQRMRAFPRERLAEELEYFAFHQAPTIVLCDSNFGLLESDEEFVEDLIKTRERWGYPRALETSWAKNKSKRFYDIVTDLKNHGFKSSFTLALQTLNDAALTDMKRRNMKVNQWEVLADWLKEQGLDCYAELIWGAPGETPASFLEGYDRLAEKVSRIAVYPMLLLPNTAYTDEREKYGFATLRGENDDFEYVLANRTATFAESLEMQRFVYYARIFAENQYFRHVWTPLREIAGLAQSQVIRNLMAAADASPEPDVVSFRERAPLIAESPAIAAGLRFLGSSPAAQEFVRNWWRDEMVPRFPETWRGFAADLYEYDHWTRPVYEEPGGNPPAGWHGTDGGYVTEPVTFGYDVAQVLADWAAVGDAVPSAKETTYVFEAPRGYHDNLDNHETAAHYVATARRLPA